MESFLDLDLPQKYSYTPLKGQLLKWIGSKHRFAKKIISFFPEKFDRYIEPFLGSGSVLATLSPKQGSGSDNFKPLIEIMQKLKHEPKTLVDWYTERWNRIRNSCRKQVYEEVKKSFNQNPNGADFVFLSRSCYGGVIRFRQNDGYMSTPCGIHNPINPKTFEKRVFEWHPRVQRTQFIHSDYIPIMEEAREGDLIYCDPPYSHSQRIVYGAQTFKIGELLNSIDICKTKGVFVVLSIDGTKKSGNYLCDLPIPKNLFRREVYIEVGRSMLKRFQMNGKTLEQENVKDRLLLTY